MEENGNLGYTGIICRIKWLRRAYMDTLPRKSFKSVEFFLGEYPLHRGCTRVNRRYMAAHGDIQASGPHSIQHGSSVHRGDPFFGSHVPWAFKS